MVKILNNYEFGVKCKHYKETIQELQPQAEQIVMVNLYLDDTETEELCNE